MVSPAYLASSFCRTHELLPLLARPEAHTLTLIPIPVRAVDWHAQSFSRYQTPIDPRRPLAQHNDGRRSAYRAIAQYVLQVLNPSAPTIAGLQPEDRASFHVLLLATNQDLGPTRERLAKFLRNIYGVVVEENSTYQGQQVVVLLQGYRWEDGQLANTWLETPAERRLLFLCRDEYWPPASMIEFGAMTEIKAFRQQRQPMRCFDHPDQLLEQVVEALTALRQKAMDPL